VFGDDWDGFSVGDRFDMGATWYSVLKEAFSDSSNHRNKLKKFNFDDTFFSSGGLYYVDPDDNSFHFIMGDFGHVAAKNAPDGEVAWRHAYINYYGQSGFNFYLRPDGKPDAKGPSFGGDYFKLLLIWMARSGIHAAGLNEYAGFRPSPTQDLLVLHSKFYEKLGFMGVDMKLLGTMFGTSKVSGNLNRFDMGGDQMLFEEGFTEPCNIKTHINQSVGLASGCWCGRVKDEVKSVKTNDKLHDGKRTKGIPYKDCPKMFAAAVNLLGGQYKNPAMKKLLKQKGFAAKFGPDVNLHAKFWTTLRDTIFSVGEQMMIDPRHIVFLRYGFPKDKHVAIYGLEGIAKQLAEHKFAG